MWSALTSNGDSVAGEVSILAPWFDGEDLDALIAILAVLNRYYIEKGTAMPLQMDGRIRYEREPVGQEEWLTIPLLERVGAGDCEDLAAAWAASYGGSPIIRPSQPGAYHAVVRLPSGQIVDPSRALGMGGAGGKRRG